MNSGKIPRKVTTQSAQPQIREAVKAQGQFKGLTVSWNKTSVLQKLFGDVGKRLYLWSGLGKSDIERFHHNCADQLVDHFGDMGDREAIRQILVKTLSENKDIMAQVSNLEVVTVDSKTISELKNAMAPKIKKQNEAFLDRTIKALNPDKDKDLMASIQQLKSDNPMKLMTIADVTKNIEQKKISNREVSKQKGNAQVILRNKMLFNQYIDRIRYPSTFSKDKGLKDYFNSPMIQSAFNSGLLTEFKGVFDGSKALRAEHLRTIKTLLGDKIYKV